MMDQSNPFGNIQEEAIVSNAVICMHMYHKGGAIAVGDETLSVEHRLLDSIRQELALRNGCTAVKPGNIALTLSGTSEPEAMKIARLVRNAFQRMVLSDHADFIAIGVLLHGETAIEPSAALVSRVEELASRAALSDGNKIECCVINAQ